MDPTPDDWELQARLSVHEHLLVLQLAITAAAMPAGGGEWLKRFAGDFIYNVTQKGSFPRVLSEEDQLEGRLACRVVSERLFAKAELKRNEFVQMRSGGAAVAD